MIFSQKYHSIYFKNIIWRSRVACFRYLLQLCGNKNSITSIAVIRGFHSFLARVAHQNYVFSVKGFKIVVVPVSIRLIKVKKNNYHDHILVILSPSFIYLAIYFLFLILFRYLKFASLDQLRDNAAYNGNESDSTGGLFKDQPFLIRLIVRAEWLKHLLEKRNEPNRMVIDTGLDNSSLPLSLAYYLRVQPVRLFLYSINNIAYRDSIRRFCLNSVWKSLPRTIFESDNPVKLDFGRKCISGSSTGDLVAPNLFNRFRLDTADDLGKHKIWLICDVTPRADQFFIGDQFSSDLYCTDLMLKWGLSFIEMGNKLGFRVIYSTKRITHQSCSKYIAAIENKICSVGGEFGEGLACILCDVRVSIPFTSTYFLPGATRSFYGLSLDWSKEIKTEVIRQYPFAYLEYGSDD